MTQEEQIIECEEKLLCALKNADVDTLDELLDNNLVFNIPTGETISKQMDIENYRSGVMKVHNILVIDRTIQTFENVSTVVVTIYLKAEYNNQIVEGKFSYLRVWKLYDTSWKIIAGSGVQIQS